MEYQCLPNCRYVPSTSQDGTYQRPVLLFCELVGFTTNALRSAKFILLSKEAEIVDGAHASTHLTLFYDVFNTSLSFRPRARGKLCSRGFIFSSGLQHTARSEFPSWWRYKCKNTKWTYLWGDIIQNFTEVDKRILGMAANKKVKASRCSKLKQVKRKRDRYSEGSTSCYFVTPRS